MGRWKWVECHCIRDRRSQRRYCQLGSPVLGVGLSVSWFSWLLLSAMGREGAIEHRVGSHWVMVSKWLGLVGTGVGDMVEDGRRRSMQWASDCHHELPLRRRLAYDIFHDEGLGELMGGAHWVRQHKHLILGGGAQRTSE